MKKKLVISLLLLVCAICCVFGLAACGGDPQTGTGDGNGSGTGGGAGGGGGGMGADEPQYIFYRLNDDGESYRVSGSSESIIGDIAVPAEYEGKPVTAIGEHAFSHHTSLTGITLPDGIETIGDNAFFACLSLTSITISDSVTSIGDEAFGCTGITGITIPDSVTYIGEYTFDGCESLTSIVIPDSVRSIGGNVFNGCKSLTDITMPDGIAYIGSISYNGCASLTSVTIPDDVKSIDDEAFRDCASLASITIPAGVTSIGERAFYGCKSLTSMAIPNSVTSIGRGAFNGCSGITSLTIPDSITSVEYGMFLSCPVESVTMPANFCTAVKKSALKTVVITGGESIPANAFKDCATLTDITVSGNITSIGENAFNGCASLASITIPDGVTSIGERAFYGCASLTGLVLPSTVTTIGSNAFSGCTSIASVAIPAGVTSIGASAFYRCSSLASITVNDNNTAYASQDGVLYNKAKTTLILAPQAIKTVTIPDSVTSIGGAAFVNCEVATVIIPNSVTSIGSSAFESCKITNMTVPDTVTSVGDRAFYESTIENATIPARLIKQINNSALKTAVITGGTAIDSYAFYECRQLTSVTIPDTVTSIGGFAFASCSSLRSLTIPDSVTSINGSAFFYCGLKSVTIPDSVNHISTDAFEGCPIESATIPASACVYIGDYANNAALKTVVITSGANISSYAFNGCSGLTSITVPDSVTTVGSRAFYGCPDLSEVVGAENICTLGQEAFDGTAFWTEFLNQTDDVLYFGKVLVKAKADITECKVRDGVVTIMAEAFKDSALTSITIPDSVTTVDNQAFGGCTSLQTVVAPLAAVGSLPSSVQKLTVTSGETVTANAFAALSSLIELVVGDGVQGFELGALSGLGSLQKLTVPYLKSSSGASYTLGMLFGQQSFDGASQVTQIVGNTGTNGANPIEGQYYVPDTLTNITVTGALPRIGAFSGCGSLTDIVIDCDVNVIPYYTFYNCASLKTITLPSTLETVEHFAVLNCAALEKIYYAGTETSWSFPQAPLMDSKVTVLNQNDDISEKVYWYSDEPTEDGRFWYYDENDVPVIW